MNKVHEVLYSFTLSTFVGLEADQNRSSYTKTDLNHTRELHMAIRAQLVIIYEKQKGEGTYLLYRQEQQRKIPKYCTYDCAETEKQCYSLK